MRVLVCGGRRYDNREKVFETLRDLAAQHGWLTIIEGGATGADALARAWARENYHGLVTVKANWDRYDDAAGPIRNEEMLIKGKPDLVIAFPGNYGTQNMTMQAASANVKIMRIR